MKKVTINYYECVSHLTLITGVNPITGEYLKIEEKVYGLLNEQVSQGVKTRLDRILKSLKDPFESWEKSRNELLKKHKGESEKLEGENLENFVKEFKEVTQETFEVEIDTIEMSKLEDFISPVNYTSLINCITE